MMCDIGSPPMAKHASGGAMTGVTSAKLAAFVLKSDIVEDLVEMIWGFDNLTDIRELTRFFEKYLPG